MSPETWSALGITLKVALATTLLILPPGLLAALFLARRSFPGKTLLETLFALPLVLPPTAVGYILLRTFGRGGPLGRDTLGFDPGILLTWRGAVIASAVMSFPLLVRTARVAFTEVDPRLEGMARTLGLGPIQVFFRVTLPLAAKGLLAGTILAFSRALGEFGATVIVAGSIPGKTRTLSLAIYQNIQLGKDAETMQLLFITVLLAFAAVWTVEILTRRASASRSAAREGADA